MHNVLATASRNVTECEFDTKERNFNIILYNTPLQSLSVPVGEVVDQALGSIYHG